MFQLDICGSIASVSATWNWIPVPSSVVVGNNSNSTLLPVQQDGFVELPMHLIADSGTTKAFPLALSQVTVGGAGCCACHMLS